MVSLFVSGIKLQTGNKNPFNLLLTKPIRNFRRPLSLTLQLQSQPQLQLQLQLQMVTQSKRPICPSCTKPTQICLCNRMTTSILHNSKRVTILQHSLEINHPLNSTRIATIGLNNLNLARVSDVLFQAHFHVHVPHCPLLSSSVDDETSAAFCGIQYHQNGQFSQDSRGATSCFSFTIEKHGAISSFNHQFVSVNGKNKVSLDTLLASSVASPLSDFTKGFVVKKLKLRQSHEGGVGYEDSEEFEMEVPSGSVLLFPSEKSVGPEEINFEVTNLIVLDGTWAKARRMYNENPWLKLLPHLRLDLDKRSLYGEVRNQPRDGYLSTIESIVYALKAVGENPEGLDGLLYVFESMIGDQRRCKDERLSKAANLL